MLLEGGIEKNYTQNWDKNGNIYYTDENGQVVDFKINPFTKLANKAKATAYNIGNWLNETNPNSEAYKQKVGTVLGLVTAPLGLGATLTGGIARGLAPFVGKKIARNMAQGIGSGVAGGGVAGGLEAGLNDRNIAIGGLQGAITGGLLGGLGGYGLGKVGQKFERSLLQNNPIAQEQYFNDYVADLNNKTKAMADFRAGKIGVKKGGNGKLYNFIGKNSYFGNPSKIREAELMNALDEEPEKIFEETGWFKGVDGKWRKEIPDGNLIENPNVWETKNTGFDEYQISKLGDIYDNPELYQAYPKLKDLSVLKSDLPDGVGGISTPNSIHIDNSLYLKHNPDYYEQLNKLKQTPEVKRMDEIVNEAVKNGYSEKLDNEYNNILSNTENGKLYNSLVYENNIPQRVEGWNDDALDTFVHEIQHQIQAIEGFARGGNSSLNPNYKNLAGEVEARMAERRANLTPEQRKIYKPFGDAALLSNYGYDVLPEKQVIEFANRLSR